MTNLFAQNFPLRGEKIFWVGRTHKIVLDCCKTHTDKIAISK